ncbi:MAG: bacillithiol biosynthesis deacetylase BshB1, partial [Flavobacteriales bacterium]|nr:bacillithiol biosynthesis deacetylase BshB1 [Flavobacteriales bacterium]
LISDSCFYSGLIKIKTEDDGKNQEKWRPKAVYHYIQDRFIKPDFVVDVTPFVDKKIEAIKCFSSQFFNPESTEPKTPISGEDFFEFIAGRMMQYGREINVKYAEGFTVERYLGVEDLLGLK